MLAQSCQDNREANMSPNEVYVVNSGKVLADVYDTGEDPEYNLGVTKSGYVDVAATAEIVVSAQALATYNAANSLNIKPLPTDCYTVVSNKVEFSAQQISALYPIVFHIEKLKAFAQQLITEKGEVEGKKAFAEYAVAVELTKSNVQINFEKKFSIIFPTLKQAVIGMTLVGETILTVDKNSTTLLANLPVAVPFKNNWNIACTFESTQADFDAFNATKGGALTLIPAEAYTITPAEFVLAKGKQQGNLLVSIDKSKLSFASYCLPVRLTGTNMEKIIPDVDKAEKKDNAISYITVNTLVSIPRDSWTVKSVSSASGSEGTNGAGALAIDADVKTYWHSAWETPALPPHNIVVDMGKEWILGAVTFTPRNNPQTGTVEVSSDGETWTNIGSFKMKDAKADQTFPMTTPTSCRYFKVIITTDHAQIFDLKAMGGPVELAQ